MGVQHFGKGLAGKEGGEAELGGQVVEGWSLEGKEMI